MSLLRLENLSKRYQDFSAVTNVSLEISQGEFFGLLGASGSGKTTLLRMIAGLDAPDEGEIIFAGQNIKNLAPEKRDFGMVFQNYALFPHLDVFENVAFGLKARKFTKNSVKRKVAEVLDLIKLSGFEKRRIDELSGGQQQRVAIARAIAIAPQLLLFDEPLSNLDVTLREETRGEIKELVEKLNLTAIYVTHDQDETFALCDRVSIMSEGKLLRTGTPRELYENPGSVVVAKFLGRNNLIRAARTASNKIALSEFQTLEGEHRLFADTSDTQNPGSMEDIVTLAIRPENLKLTFGAEFFGDNSLKAVIKEAHYFGATTRVILDANRLKLEAVLLRLADLKIGDVCSVSLPPNRISVLKD